MQTRSGRVAPRPSGFQPNSQPNSETKNPFRHEPRPERGTSAPMHRPVAQAAVAAFAEIILNGRFADKVIERAFKSAKSMGSRDRKQFAELVYDLVRWYRRFGYAIGVDTETVQPQLIDFWKWLAALLVERSVQRGGRPSLPPWTEFHGLNADEIANRLSEIDPAKMRAVHQSIPDWLDQLGEKELGRKWDSVLQASNQPAPVILRANTLKCTREELIERLSEEESLHATPARHTQNGVHLSERKNIFGTPLFKEGWFEVQDGASQLVAEMVGAQPGERVIDACAGAGGKTLAIAAMMKNKGRLLALDVQEKKLQELRRRVARAGVDTCEAKLIDSAKVIKRLEKSADRVLLDVPCSGLGVLRRTPDKKWKFSQEELDHLRGLQAQILDEYSAMVRVGGTVVYATCSILPSENDQQIKAFLQRANGTGKPSEKRFELIQDRHFWPGDDGYDGFYAAILKRIAD